MITESNREDFWKHFRDIDEGDERGLLQNFSSRSVCMTGLAVGKSFRLGAEGSTARSVDLARWTRQGFDRKDVVMEPTIIQILELSI